MRKSNFLYFFVFQVAVCISLQSQNSYPTVRVRKGSTFYFFQQGQRSDTISAGKGDLFIYGASDTLQRSALFSLDNAQLISEAGDSLYRLRYVPGIRYECFFSKPEPGSKNKTWGCYVNGASSLNRNHIRVQLIEKQSSELLLENHFFYK